MTYEIKSLALKHRILKAEKLNQMPKFWDWPVDSEQVYPVLLLVELKLINKKHIIFLNYNLKLSHI